MSKLQDDNRLFDNAILEWFSKTNAYLVIIINIVIAVAIVFYGNIKSQISISIQIIIFISGLIIFTLTEYIIHRYVYHSQKLQNKANFSVRLHNIHHDRPKDKQRLALPLPAGLSIASILYFVFWLVLGKFTPFFFAGFFIGYNIYLLIHYLIHTKRPPNSIFRALWINHYFHHYKNSSKSFGVTSPFWDIIFKTMPLKNK